MFGFKKKNANVLSHWYVIVDGFQFSTQDFYQEIEKELTARKVPGLRVSRVEYHEGGLLSDKRIYLRLARERLAFDVCAAPFGRAYFFSLRFVEMPRFLLPRVIVLIVLGLMLLYAVHTQSLIAMACVIGIAGLAVIVIQQVRANRFESADTSSRKTASSPPSSTDDSPFSLDDFFLSAPVIGDWYEQHRAETYYRQDTRLMYHTIISEVVKKKVEEVTATNGVKFIETHEHSPILDELYKSKAVSLQKE
jgi:hypothetical protein